MRKSRARAIEREEEGAGGARGKSLPQDQDNVQAATYKQTAIVLNPYSEKMDENSGPEHGYDLIGIYPDPGNLKMNVPRGSELAQGGGRKTQGARRK